MEEYKELYFNMFNKITDIIEELKNLQQECEARITECER